MILVNFFIRLKVSVEVTLMQPVLFSKLLNIEAE